MTFPIIAAHGGRLWRHDEGEAVSLYIKYPNSQWQTKYTHVDKNGILGGLGNGQSVDVTAGQQIAMAGSTGATSIHLHFELRGWAVANFTSYPYHANNNYPSCSSFNNSNWTYPIPNFTSGGPVCPAGPNSVIVTQTIVNPPSVTVGQSVRATFTVKNDVPASCASLSFHAQGFIVEGRGPGDFNFDWTQPVTIAAGDSYNYVNDKTANVPAGDYTFWATFRADSGGLGEVARAPGVGRDALLHVFAPNLGCNSVPTTGAVCAEYFPNRDFSGGPIFSQNEATPINHSDWGTGGPGNGVPNDNFSARYRGNLLFAGGNWRFTAAADDGVRVYLDDQILIDRWIDQGTTTYTADVFVPAGWHQVKVEYYEHDGGAYLTVGWAQFCGANPKSRRASRSIRAPRWWATRLWCVS